MLCCSLVRGDAEDDEDEMGVAADSISPFFVGSDEDDGTFLSVAFGFGTEFSLRTDIWLRFAR